MYAEESGSIFFLNEDNNKKNNYDLDASVNSNICRPSACTGSVA
jgi:hypothetical protein